MTLSLLGRTTKILVASFLGLSPLILHSATANTEVRSHVVSAGGNQSVSPTMTMSSTAGQPVSTAMAGPTQGIQAGFWYLVGQAGATIGTPPFGPAQFALSQSFPNPFRLATQIHYELPHAVSKLTLQVFDVGGKRVVTLHDGPESAGKKTATWNGRNNQGQVVASGVYFVMMNTQDYKAVRKTIVIR